MVVGNNDPQLVVYDLSWSVGVPAIYHWVGLRENLQETIVFTMKYGGFP